MTNRQIINKFFLYPRESKCNNLRIEKRDRNYVLVNYSTDLVLWNPRANHYHVNETKYSVSTSKIQSIIREYVPSFDCTTVDGCERGFKFRF